jgi:homoserine kinase type II
VSVFTCISHSQLDQFFSAYNLGAVVSFEGISDGIDNTNYWVNTTQGRFVLTLFESLSADELPDFLNLLSHLHQNNLPCPRAEIDLLGNALRHLNGKPAVLFNALSGAAIASPTTAQCREIGLQLARLHHCTQDYVFPVNSSNGLIRYKMLRDKIDAHLSKEDRQLLDDELAFQANNSPENLPQGVIHADLFRDNVLFDGDKLSGLLDFYSACTDALLFDVAVTVNDWCCDEGVVNVEKVTALLSAYDSLRPFTDQEKQQTPTLLRAAALRFWLSRLEHRYFPRTGELTQQKDPLTFRRILLQHRQAPASIF